MTDELGVVGGRIDVLSAIEAAPPGEWRNEVLTRVNDAVVRLGVIEGEYHWHSHAEEDEFFLTLDGELLLKLRDPDGAERVVSLSRLQGFTVPAGVVHRTRAEQRTAILMVERATVVPEGEAAAG